jgi:DHA2 family methylenomycin A resistance protein-like MFS transporter
VLQYNLHTDVGGLQWIIDSYNLTFASLLLTGGTLGDLFGRKRLFLIGLLVFSSGSLLCGIALAFPILLIGRILQGIGAALELPGTLAILTVTYADPKERAWPIFFLNVPIGVLTFALAIGAA